MMTVRELLQLYDEITIDAEIADGICLFSLLGKQFLFFAPSQDDPTTQAQVYLYNDTGMDLPHIMLREDSIGDNALLPKGIYRWVCLYEQESIVHSIIPYEEKITDAVDRLIYLLSMNKSLQEREFQKEFLYYWNSSAINSRDHSVYLSKEDIFTEMKVYFGESDIRIVDSALQLSDINDSKKNRRVWNQHFENEAYYVPITDVREILPPHRGYNWTAKDIINIVYSKQIEHISKDTFQSLMSAMPKTQNIIIVFGMKTELCNATFAVKVNCNNVKGHPLLKKILNDVISVEPLRTTRKDYLYLNEQIGNDIGLINKKVLLIGAGSLGSYVAFELVKNGASRIKIYDGDKLEEANLLRWAYGGFGIGTNKATTVSVLLNMMHPEIEVEAIPSFVNEKTIVEEVSSFDIVIITIGNSDKQLKLNRALSAANSSIPVIYVWLEAGGLYSHILVVNYQTSGCFECLYTTKNGIAVNNRASKNTDVFQDAATIRNGCGGTRAAYGTTILLRTTAVLLDVVRQVISKEITDSKLIDISPESVVFSDIIFPEEACNCCGHKKKQ